MDKEYIKLIKWLKTYDKTAVEDGKKNKEEFAHLVVSQKLLVEYIGSANHPSSKNDSSNFIHIFISLLTIQGRLVKIEKKEIGNFKQKIYTKTIERKFQSNKKDQNHIPIVLMSNRKMALTLDKNFKTDLENFPGFKVQVEERPQNLNYQ